MSQHEIRAKVEKLLENHSVGTMATVKNNKPHTRFMTFFHDNLKLYTATSKDTDKTEEIEENPYTHILIGYGGEGYGDEFVDYQGKVSINNSNELKKKLWNEKMEQWFEGPDDPNYIILEIEPVTIRLMTNQIGDQPKEVEI
ncbi:general stress protein [Ornithinibacillus sp. L9]|uniref:General stress protein n=1 Tax=Ornithinibacillus caprae TaxID=2678566 RepID=A0A6N8FGK5_9BACI|nr:pyridoxamine 5'-phosphate oxidase family protein [Ornithinibacillus caprae]MUK88603.1 general stress protein [Ornithinibacillus caprae]